MANLTNDQKRKNFNRGDEEDDLIILKQNENAKKAHYLSYTDRYFTRYYKLDVRHANNDHLILMHSNRVAVCAIAPSHPLLDKSKYKVSSVEFVQSVNEEMSGKHKNFAKNLHVSQPFCKVHCQRLDMEPSETPGDQTVFTIYSCLNAKLIELNEKLLKTPELLQEKPFTEGFLAVLFPKLDTLNEQLSELITHDQYVAQRKVTSN